MQVQETRDVALEQEIIRYSDVSPIRQQLSQLKVLLKKNYWLFTRDTKTLSLAILSPILFIVLLFCLQEVYVHEMNQLGEFPEPETIPRIPICQPWGDNSCWTLLYSAEEVNNTLLGDISSYLFSYPIGYHSLDYMNCPHDFVSIAQCTNVSQEFTTSTTSTNYSKVHDIMRFIAQHNSPPLQEASSLTLFDGDYFFLSSSTLMYNYLADHANQTQNAIVFRTYQGNVLGYTVLFNDSLSHMDLNLPSVIRAIDEASHSLDVVTRTELQVHVERTGFPKSKPRFLSSSIIQMAGPVFFFCPPMLLFIILLNAIVHEKEKKLRQGMNIMGLSDSMFWLSWFITAEILFASVCTLTIISGMIAQFEFFTKVRFGCNFLAFFLFSSAMTPVLFICSTLVSTTKQANLVGFFIFLSGLFLQMIFTNVAIYYWYSPDSWDFWLLLFNFYPPFNFAKCCADFILLAYPSYSFATHEYSVGSGYHWTDVPQPVYVPLINIYAPPTLYSFLYLPLNMVGFMLLAWYLDNVIPSVNGARKPFYFPLLPSYWEIHITKNDEPLNPAPMVEMQEFSSSQSILDFSDDDEFIDDDEPLLSTNDLSNSPKRVPLAVEIENLCKNYSRSCIWQSKDKKKQAVSDFCVEIERGTIFCLLGHNGAGKTTLFNMLTGVLEPTSGNATLFGLDIQKQREAIREIMGVCPQHDLLWDDLTAWQHLEIFAELRGIPGRNRKQVIVAKLEEVELLHVSHSQVKTFSGGMKRRLSVAISSICNPKILFFDEPTTGLDPVSKRSVWKLIKNLKDDRVIIFTTHSMEEAEYLADRVGIMNQGILMASGTSMELRKQFGNGYKLYFTTKPEKSDLVQKAVLELLPEAKFVNANAGSLTYTIGADYLLNVAEFFENLQSDNTVYESILDWGISHSSLEEVFHNITITETILTK